ncbi:MAG: S41 family peptidase [Defluviitaleaceae bacterium]|nr:S41 family peptidase [Defluviitaleaceae bacterium]MCL2274590.1 S41 family peptidase [Defluviitaleaceae bacterium]
MLTPELKIYELSLIWKEAAYNFAFWESLSLTLDWDKAYREALPAVLATQNLYEYYRELQKFIALLRDGHTGIHLPQELYESPEYASKLPIRIAYTNGRFVISNVKRVAGEAVKRWSVLHKIDGIQIQDYLTKNVFPYIWHEKLDSAQHDINEMLSIGALGSTVALECEYEGKLYTAHLTRAKGDTDWLYSDTVHPVEELECLHRSHSHAIALTQDNLAIITVDTMMDNHLPDEFYANYPLLEKARGYIIDIRQNGGGDSNNSDAVVAAFIEGEFINQRALHPVHNGTHKAWDIPQKSEEHISYGYRGDNPNPTLTAPLVVLTTAQTGSAAEDLLITLEHAKRATFVGTPSCGTTGQPLRIDLESGGSLFICTRHNTHIDGREFINIGVQPHVFFEPSIEDLISGRDTHMAKGLSVLRENVHRKDESNIQVSP